MRWYYFIDIRLMFSIINIKYTTMNLKSQYNELPFLVRQKISYEQIRNYVFLGSRIRVFERILRSKLVGYRPALVIKESRTFAKQYGCVNEKELFERSTICSTTQSKVVVGDKVFFAKLYWQTNVALN